MRLTSLLLSGLVLISAPTVARSQDGRDPVRTELMAVDMFLARTGGMASTIVGTAFYVLSLPFTMPSGDSERVADRFIHEPLRFTFDRPLGRRLRVYERYLEPPPGN
ncbi:MAG: hypothetical protein QNJ94_19850 [Alphaproteobacteria bacterium]|nr:hypothetical protein [Alphaproteobacteria bacterium]